MRYNFLFPSPKRNSLFSCKRPCCSSDHSTQAVPFELLSWLCCSLIILSKLSFLNGIIGFKLMESNQLVMKTSLFLVNCEAYRKVAASEEVFEVGVQRNSMMDADCRHRQAVGCGYLFNN